MREILDLLQRGKFKQVISKLKRGGLAIKKDRVEELLLRIHLEFAEDLMQRGDFIRAVREFDNAYSLKNDDLIWDNANEKVLNISLPQKRRAWMDGLFDNIKQNELPYNYP